MDTLRGALVELRSTTDADLPDLARIRATPEVEARWGHEDDPLAAIVEDRADPEVTMLTIVHNGRIVGSIQFGENTDPEYRSASIDIYLDPSAHGRGLGSDSVRTLARWLIEERGHHRLTIDPAADNAAAIACYAKVGFRPVGVMRRYERGLDGTFHDGLLMDLLAEELT
jgi:aminoglycoside 6'-N-acetyltransferase